MSTIRFTRTRLLAATALLAVGLASSPVFAANTWLGTAVMPKSDQLRIQNGQQSVGGIFDISWPAVVSKTNGRWLWIEDDGGYSVPPVGGWVYADDVVKLDGARDYYTKQLAGNKSAVYYWLRGIYWESQGETTIALDDYRAARAYDQAQVLDDAAIRYGRLLAFQNLRNGAMPYRPANPPPDQWEEQFQAAERMNGRRPQLYLDWGLAASQECRCRLSGRGIRSDAQKTAQQAQQVAAFIDAQVKNAEQMAKDLANPPANNPPDANAAKTLTKTLAGAAQLAKVVTVDVLAIAQQASEFGTGLKLPDPDKPQHLTAPLTADEGAKKVIAAIIEAANRATDANVPLRQAIAAAPADSSVQQQPKSQDQIDADIKASATAAFDHFARARTLNPNWWRVPVALGELLLNHYERQTPHGDLQPLRPLSVGFLQALGTFRARGAGAGNELPPPTSAAGVPLAGDVLVAAREYFDQGISLNSQSIDAYRDRAEVFRLMAALDKAQNQPQMARHHLSSAESSAAQACMMGNYRQPGTLRTLAQVYQDLNLPGPALDLAQRSLEFLPPEDQPLYEPFWNNYRQLAQKAGIDSPTELLASNVEPGAAPTRGDKDGEAALNAKQQLADLVSQLSESDSGLNISLNDLSLKPTTRGDGSSDFEVQMIQRAPPLPRGFTPRAP